MTTKTRTVVVIEIHEQTIVRRSRRMVSAQVATPGAVARGGVPIAKESGAVARPSGRAPSDVTVLVPELMPPPPESVVRDERKSLGRWWKTVALKSATALAPLSRLKTSAGKRRNRLS